MASITASALTAWLGAGLATKLSADSARDTQPDDAVLTDAISDADATISQILTTGTHTVADTTYLETAAKGLAQFCLFSTRRSD